MLPRSFLRTCRTAGGAQKQNQNTETLQSSSGPVQHGKWKEPKLDLRGGRGGKTRREMKMEEPCSCQRRPGSGDIPAGRTEPAPPAAQTPASSPSRWMCPELGGAHRERVSDRSERTCVPQRPTHSASDWLWARHLHLTSNEQLLLFPISLPPRTRGDTLKRDTSTLNKWSPSVCKRNRSAVSNQQEAATSKLCRRRMNVLPVAALASERSVLWFCTSSVFCNVICSFCWTQNISEPDRIWMLNLSWGTFGGPTLLSEGFRTTLNHVTRCDLTDTRVLAPERLWT